jgi:hydroxylaminobenzene mutase
MGSRDTRERLIWHGMFLFLLGLLTGLTLPLLKAEQLGLSAHLAALMGGMFLMILGLIWGHVKLQPRLLTVTFALALYSSYVNWGANLLAGAFGGSSMLPIAAGGQAAGTVWQDNLLSVGLTSCALAILACCLLVLCGLRRSPARARPGS